jgi:hypothetical protein
MLLQQLSGEQMKRPAIRRLDEMFVINDSERGLVYRHNSGRHGRYPADGRVISLGCFERLEDAVKVRREAEIIHHPFRKAA